MGNGVRRRTSGQGKEGQKLKCMLCVHGPTKNKFNNDLGKKIKIKTGHRQGLLINILKKKKKTIDLLSY